MRVSFCITCIADNILTNVGIKSVELLEKLGCAVTFNPSQTCCGQPLVNTGYPEKAKASDNRASRTAPECRIAKRSRTSF
jgi:L-lactate dehydrogenase complex protein LldE